MTPAGGPGSAAGSTGLDSTALVVRTPGEVLLEQREVPRPGAGEVLIEPELVGLCGTDLEIIDGTIDPAYLRYPLALGHEWTGRTADGTRVVVEGIIACGHCLRCRSGETNLCETYDEIGFTRDGPRAGTWPSRPAWCTRWRPRSAPRTRC